MSVWIAYELDREDNCVEIICIVQEESVAESACLKLIAQRWLECTAEDYYSYELEEWCIGGERISSRTIYPEE